MRNHLRFDLCKDAFRIDGSLRDIYVCDTNVSDWEKFLQYASEMSTEYSRDGEILTFPTDVQTLPEDTEHVHLLSINLDRIVVNCHFFCVEEIELDIDPKEITSQQEMNVLIDFLGTIGALLGKTVVLTEENNPKSIWFVFTPETGQVSFVPS